MSFDLVIFFIHYSKKIYEYFMINEKNDIIVILK